MAIELQNITLNDAAEAYIAPPGLLKTAELAYALKRPLLLSGEPGTGKTRFANYLADALKTKGFSEEPLIFNTKTTSVAQDLFYHYDAIAQFRDNNLTRPDPKAEPDTLVQKPKTTADYTQLKSLGLAMAAAVGGNDLTIADAIKRKSELPAQATGNVVLIDEIDKAPRDFPN